MTTSSLPRDAHDIDLIVGDNSVLRVWLTVAAGSPAPFTAFSRFQEPDDPDEIEIHEIKLVSGKAPSLSDESLEALLWEREGFDWDINDLLSSGQDEPEDFYGN